MGSELDNDTELALIAATAHELKTPLTLINGMSSMLETETFGSLNFKQREQIRHIHKASQRLSFLIESLLHLENLPYSTQKLEPVQIHSALQRAIDDLSEQTAEKDITIRYSFNRLPPVLADPVSIYQVLMHILGASIKYSRPGSAIDIRTKRRGGEAVVQVRDASLGVAPKEIKNIKQAFGRQRQPVKTRSDSSGLSLYLIQSIVEFYGGSLSTSALNSGSALTICLPISHQLSLFEGS